jgi:protein-disulfide isomerase
MFRYLCLPPSVRFRPNRASLFLALAVAALLLLASPMAQAQFAAPSPGTHVMDTSALHPPPGARVAIVEFVDMECPICGSTNPIIRAAAAKYHIPIVRHDFLIPAHAWSPIAAVNARWFDLKGNALGDEYRDQVFADQPNLYNNPELLRQFTEKFAQSHGITLPFSLDPQGKLAADVKADTDLGRRTGIDHTPTVFIVTAGGKGPAFVEVQRPQSDLYTMIDQALANTPQAAPAKTAASKPAAKKPTT